MANHYLEKSLKVKSDAQITEIGKRIDSYSQDDRELILGEHRRRHLPEPGVENVDTSDLGDVSGHDRKGPILDRNIDYDEIPWYRKRWFLLVCLLVFAPGVIIVALTGEIYFKKSDVVYRFSPSQKRGFLIFAALLVAMGLIRALAQ